MSPRNALRYTAFYESLAERVRPDAWLARGGFMVPARYGDPGCETLAAHNSAVLADFSFAERLRIHGRGAARMLSAAFGCDAEELQAGASRNVMWHATEGGVRGTGTLIRDGEINFSLLALAADLAWFERAAPRFDATVRNETAERALLLLAGPYAFAVLAAARLEQAATLQRGHHATYVWSDVPVTVGRWDPLGGFVVMVANAHAKRVFDVLNRNGSYFGLTLAGQEALEMLLLEAGMPLPGIDFAPARDEAASEPRISSLSASADGGDAGDGVVLAGVELESEMPAPFAPIVIGGAVVGHTLRSAYSPALRRAIALAQLPGRHAAPGTEAAVRTLTVAGTVDVAARISALPFLSPSGP